MSSSFERGTEQHLLTIATPTKCLPVDSYRKKFRSHVDSKELRAVGVNPIEFSSNSFKLGGLKYLGLNRVVSLVFTNPTHPSPAKVGFSKFPTYSLRKRTFDIAIPKRPPILRTVGNPKVSVPQATRKSPLVPPTGTATSATDQSFRHH